MIGGIGVESMHDPRSSQEGYIDANGVIEKSSSNAGRRTIWSGGNRDVVADNQYSRCASSQSMWL